MVDEYDPAKRDGKGSLGNSRVVKTGYIYTTARVRLRQCLAVSAFPVPNYSHFITHSEPGVRTSVLVSVVLVSNGLVGREVEDHRE